MRIHCRHIATECVIGIDSEWLFVLPNNINKQPSNIQLTYHLTRPVCFTLLLQLACGDTLLKTLRKCQHSGLHPGLHYAGQLVHFSFTDQVSYCGGIDQKLV